MAQQGGAAAEGEAGGVLGWIERTGNRLPDPVFIFFYLLAALVEYVRAPLEEQHAEDVFLELGGIHLAAQNIGGFK